MLYKKEIISLLVFITLGFNGWSQQQNFDSKIYLENELVKIVFDETYGSLTYLELKEIGWRIGKRKELAQSFKLYVPTQDRRDNAVIGKNNMLLDYEVLEHKVIFKWKKLNSTDKNDLDISFTGVVELTDEGLVFSASCTNNSDLTIEAISWPYFGDFTLPKSSISTDWISFGYGGNLDKSPIFPYFSANHGYYGVDNPIKTSNTQYSHFGLIQSLNQGIYLGYHDTLDEHLVDYTFELKPGYEYNEGAWTDFGKVSSLDTIGNQPVNFEFYCTHFPYINPKEKGKLKPIAFYPYKGSWHKGADFYKSWRAEWTNNLSLPKWASKVHSWQQIHINSAEDRPVFQYKDLIDYCKECAENKVSAIQLTGWTLGGQDRSNPSHDIDPLLGTYTELKNSIKQCKDLGVKVVLFNKYTWADESQDWFKSELINYAVKDPFGNYRVYDGYQYQTPMQLADINTRRLIPMCPLSEDWIEIAVDEFIKSLDLGADGMLWDENQHHGGAFYCFDKNHGHQVPANILPGDKLIEDRFWEVIQKRNPDYLMVGESNRDLQFQSYHMSYFRIGNHYTGLHRYVAPEQKMMIAVTGYNDRNILNRALMNNYIISYEPRNFKGKLREYPLTLEYGKQIDALRRTYKAYLWDGIYMDTLGAIVTENNNRYANYSVFENSINGKKAVVIINPDYFNVKKFHVQVSNLNGELFYVDPENQREKKYNGLIEVQPLSVVVLIEK
ncbi:DUF6259 domain-containing protein [Tamlana sp. 2201CG12-4]|uniref:DUF6259 domain-containing protein n=1 Tax=Tamlana sp. 2201CG12-4 TaxID=3112582 RepID=UPI002DC04DFF|nr:DUF6259 domain-containing protein [Tamlana sp. 2201CG12-4]MEC3907636.1 DUF6259 domain-containing protein [Tamlana sp. 2201CG12-4]